MRKLSEDLRREIHSSFSTDNLKPLTAQRRVTLPRRQSSTVGIACDKCGWSSPRKLRDAAGKSFISAEDYAVAMLDEVETPQYVRQNFTIAY
jgi:hypothetical protein